MKTLYTIGHSNHPIDEFLQLLLTHGVKQIIDVRAIPKSRWVPWFNREALQETLRLSGINYLHMPELGGRRSGNKKSINTGWKNAGFRAYADYMQTPAFIEALEMLNSHVKKDLPTAIMCAEAVPWRCHRSLIGDAEVTRGFKVLDIINQHPPKAHELTPFAVIDKHSKPIKLYYPSPNQEIDI